MAKQKVFQVLVRVSPLSFSDSCDRRHVCLQELTDSLNFGLYLPACNGRAGKFLDESRCLREYPLSGPVSYLEVRPLAGPTPSSLTHHFLSSRVS